MTPLDVGKLLTIASGFDRRVVDDMTVAAWHSVPEVQAGTLEQAQAVLIAHVSGPNHRDYFTVGVLADGLRRAARAAQGDVEADVRVAKAIGLVPSSHGARQPLTTAQARQLAEYRAARRAEAERHEPRAIEP